MDNIGRLHIVGCQSGVAGRDALCGEGPSVIHSSPYLTELIQQGADIVWEDMIVASPALASLPQDQAVAILCNDLALKVSQLVREKKFFAVVGGDHSCAIGTWSGVYDAMHDQGDLGLIWIDAHMDSHTAETTPSGNIHGMPLAALLGHGYSSLTHILQEHPKFKPENVCLIGVRSFEPGEAALLARLKVKIYFMDEVKSRGFKTILREAALYVKQHTIAYGVTVDMDAIDPLEAPGVDVPEPDGIHGDDLCEGMRELAHDPKLIGTEFVEFDPHHDSDHRTEKLMVDCLACVSH